MAVKKSKAKWTFLFMGNFLGVFNDNFLKYAIIFVAVNWARPDWMTQSQLISLASASLVLPYLLLSPWGGRLAVKHSKLSIFRLFKLLETPIMLVAVLGFWIQNVYIALLSVLLMGVQSSLYSPSKYGLVRDVGGKEGVSEGSGGFESMAFLGILMGTLIASLLSEDANPFWFYPVFLVVALLGYWATRMIVVEEQPVEEDVQAVLNPWKFLLHGFRVAKDHRLVNPAVFGAASFWLIGGVLQMNLVIHAHNYYKVSDLSVGLLMGLTAVGIALGTWLAGKISGKRVLPGLSMFGLMGMMLFLAVIWLMYPSYTEFQIMVFMFAVMGGLFQVPNLSVIQAADLGRSIGVVFAYLNMMTFLLILLGTALFSVVTSLTGENSFAVFAILEAICLLVFLSFVKWVPAYTISARNFLKRR